MTRTRLAVLAALTALLTCGCATGEAGRPVAAPTKPRPTAATAANGTDLAACANGDCEVQVGPSTSIPLTPPLGIGPVAVTGIQDGAVSLTVSTTLSQLDLACTGDPACDASMVGAADDSDATTVSASGHPGAQLNIDELTVTVVAVTGASAILRLRLK